MFGALPADPKLVEAAITASQRRHMLHPSLLALTFATGIVDAVSYLAVGGVFTANMTGNLVLVGFALGGAPGFTIPRTVASLVAFVVGATIAGHLARHWYPRPFVWMQRITRLVAVAFAVVLGLVAVMPGGVTEGTGIRMTIIVILGLSMGIVNATARRLGFRDIPITVATSTISDLASESRFGGGERRNQGNRLLAITAMLAGALSGALLVLEVSPTLAFSLAVAASLFAVVHQERIARRHPGQPLPAS